VDEFKPLPVARRDAAAVVPPHVPRLLADGAGKAVQVGAKVVNLLCVTIAQEGEAPAACAVSGAADVELRTHALPVARA